MALPRIYVADTRDIYSDSYICVLNNHKNKILNTESGCQLNLSPIER